MDKDQQPAFWQRLTNCAKTQKIDLDWWLVLLIFFGMSASTLLVWHSLLSSDRSQMNKLSVQLEAVTINPSAPIPLTFAGSGASLELTKILAKQFQKTHPQIKLNVPVSISSSAAIQAAADGAISVGISSRPLQANEKKLGLTVILFARTL